MAEEYDYLFKSIVVGDGGVGKTALTLRFSKGFFTEDYKMTIGVDFHVKTITIDALEGQIRAKLQIWDTGGQERFSSIRPMYYRGSLGALLIFDLTSYESFEHLPQWIEEVRANIKNEIPLLLVGNKSDLIDQRAVSLEEINSFTGTFNLYYMETSAKTGDGVRDCFYILAFLMIGQGIPEHLIESANIYAPGEIHKRGSQFSTSVTRINEPQVEYSAPLVPESITGYESPFRVIKREQLPKPQPTFGIIGVSSIPRREFSDRSPIFQTVKPTVSSSDSLIDYMPQSIITKTEKKKIAKEKKKQDKEKAKIEKEKKILESRERGSIFQTLAQKTEALTASQSVPFIPFTGESKTKEEGKSKLRIIPNVADIEADSSTFTAFTPTQPIQEEKPKSRSSDLLVCEQCGTILSSDYTFCNKCGNKL